MELAKSPANVSQGCQKAVAQMKFGTRGCAVAIETSVGSAPPSAAACLQPFRGSGAGLPGFHPGYHGSLSEGQRTSAKE